MSRYRRLIIMVLAAAAVYVASSILSPAKSHIRSVLPEARKTLCIKNEAGDYMYFLETIIDPSSNSRVAIAQASGGNFYLGEWVIINKTRILVVWSDRQGLTSQSMYYTTDLETCYF